MIIVVCRNNLELSKQCVNTLLAQEEWPLRGPLPKILVMDNASTDGTTQWAIPLTFNLSKRIFGCAYQEPVSVAQVWNYALDFAWVHGAHKALVVNNDTELLPVTYSILSRELERLQNANVGMVTCVSVRERERLFLPAELPEPTPHPDYSCFMIAKWAHDRVRFDEGCVGAFYEDNVHHVEMHRAGIKAMNVGLPFLHHGSMTMKTANAVEKVRIEHNAAMNREYFFGKFGCYPGTKGYERLFEK